VQGYVFPIRHDFFEFVADFSPSSQAACRVSPPSLTFFTQRFLICNANVPKQDRTDKEIWP